jgi:ABC-type transport system involved in multi-copper enzyme maturation permease subunit
MKMKWYLVLGILLGGFFGTVFALLLLKSSLVQNNLGNISYTFELAFGRFYAEHFDAVVYIAGTLVGVIIGGSMAISKLWGTVILSLFVGILIGGAVVNSTETKVFNQVSQVWEDNAASERVFAYLQALHAIDRGTTNQFYITEFQATGKTVLTNYLHETDERMQNLPNREHTDFQFTNSPTYHMVQKYLATHTNVLDNDF